MIRSTSEVLEVDEGFDGERRRTAIPSGDRTLATVERAHIEAVLDGCGWRIKARATRPTNSASTPTRSAVA